MWSRITSLLYVILLGAACLSLCSCSKSNDISGTWKGQVMLAATGKSLTDLEFTLTQNGSEVTGAMIFTKPGAKLPLSGSLKDGTLSLFSPMKNGLAVTITGRVASRARIDGEAVLDYDTPQLGKRQDRTVLALTR